MKKLFFNFLKEHDAYEQYIANAMTDHEATIDGIMERNLAENWIAAAFFWVNSPEGTNYWKVLDDEWQKVVNPDEEE